MSPFLFASLRLGEIPSSFFFTSFMHFMVVSSFPFGRWVWAGFLLLAAGCAYQPPQFVLNTEGRDPAEISPTQCEAIEGTLEELFGTPDEPKVPPGVDLNLSLLKQAAGPVYSDVEGRQFGLYRQHCVTCHGVSGDGAGPTAALQNPYPRDFRNGVYKYTSTAGGAKPAWEDLDRIIRRGIAGTAMPSFDRLSDEEIDALVEYVQYLSLRGETELYLLSLVVDEDEYPVDVDEVMEDAVLPMADYWAEAQQAVVVPPPRPTYATHEEKMASIGRGHDLYVSKQAQCVLCHGPEGRGDGEQADELYDIWNQPKKGATPEQTKRLAQFFTLPIQRLRPRDFTEGIFRGGSRPEDIYWRAYCGIKGTPMPAGGPAPGSSGVLEPEEIWDVVNYVFSRARSARR